MASFKLKKDRVKSYLDESFMTPDISTKERAASDEVFREYRKKFEAERTPKERLRIKLLELKYIMEAYLRADTYNTDYRFSYFLRQYIEKLDVKNNEFADALSITPTELSQIINNHREPTNKIILRLEAHSNRIFSAAIWFGLFSKEKTFELINDDDLRRQEERLVKDRLNFTI